MKHAREICCAQGELLSVASPASPLSNLASKTERGKRIPPGGQKLVWVESKNIPDIQTQKQQHAYANLPWWL